MTDNRIAITDMVLKDKREAEQLFCAAVYINPHNARHDCAWLMPDTFHDEKFRVFWREILADKTPAEAALKADIYDELLHLQNSIVGSFEYEAFAKKITDYSYFFNVSNLLPELMRGVHTRDETLIRETIDNLVSSQPVAVDELPDAVDVAIDFNVAIDDPQQSLKTGIIPLDKATGGFERQTLTLLAARPSMGKSSLAFQIARNFASTKQKVIFFSLEMSKRMLWARAACGALDIAWRDVKDRRLKQSQIDELKEMSMALGEKFGYNLRIDDSSRVAIDDIWKITAQYKPDVIIIDHSGLVAGKQSGEKDVKWLGRLSWAGKQIAKEYNLVSIMLQQLNRSVEYRSGHRPAMSDLRDSGELEQNADNILFIHRDDYYDESNSDISETDLIIAKFRDGARNVNIKLRYHLLRQWFYSKGELETP